MLYKYSPHFKRCLKVALPANWKLGFRSLPPRWLKIIYPSNQSHTNKITCAFNDVQKLYFNLSQRNIRISMLDMLKEQYLYVFDLRCDFEIQSPLYFVHVNCFGRSVGCHMGTRPETKSVWWCCFDRRASNWHPWLNLARLAWNKNLVIFR